MYLENLIGDCFVKLAWCALSVFFCDGKFLVEAHVMLLMHDVHCLFSIIMKTSCLRLSDIRAFSNIVSHA